MQKDYTSDQIKKEDLLKLRPVFSSFSNKYDFGHACIIAGSKGKMGALLLSSAACVSSGVGLLTVHTASKAVDLIHQNIPEAMILEDQSPDCITEYKKYDRYTAIGIGPGIGMEIETQRVLKQLIQNSINPLVLDADALNILSENKTWLAFLPNDSILTPHAKEFERLVGETFTSDQDRLESARLFAVKNKVILVLKGHSTAICSPNGKTYFNTTGNIGMAKAGSGDVLLGMITSLLAQKYTPIHAAISGVYLHGLAGDFAKEQKGEISMHASDIIQNIHHAIRFAYS